jgi:alpha-tubulin suppressor-like RCC1 family protein
VSLPSSGEPFTAVAAGSGFAAPGAFSCAVGTLGGVYCWGDNSFGELGNGTMVSSATPVRIAAPAGVSFLAVSVLHSLVGADTAGHACAVATTGAAYCWGSNSGGELGSGATGLQGCNTGLACSPTPLPVANGISFQSVSTGGGIFLGSYGGFTCGVATSGAVYCWGANDFGQLGNGTMADSPVPTPITAPTGVSFTAVSAGGAHACALATTGDLYCWGYNNFGQLGNNSTTNSATPWLVSGISFTAVSAGSLHTCGISSAPTMNTAYCWGANYQGQLGNGTTTSSATPVLVSTLP